MASRNIVFFFWQARRLGKSLILSIFFFQLERELVMDLERLKLAKSVKPKRSRDKVNEPVIYLPLEIYCSFIY